MSIVHIDVVTNNNHILTSMIHLQFTTCKSRTTRNIYVLLAYDIDTINSNTNIWIIDSIFVQLHPSHNNAYLLTFMQNWYAVHLWRHGNNNHDIYKAFGCTWGAHLEALSIARSMSLTPKPTICFLYKWWMCNIVWNLHHFWENIKSFAHQE